MRARSFFLLLRCRLFFLLLLHLLLLYLLLTPPYSTIASSFRHFPRSRRRPFLGTAHRRRARMRKEEKGSALPIERSRREKTDNDGGRLHARNTGEKREKEGGGGGGGKEEKG